MNCKLSLSQSKFIKIYFLSVLTLFAIVSLLAFSYANWQDIEDVLLNISFLSSSENATFSIYISDGENDREIKQFVQNHDFSQGMKNWDHLGEAQILKQANQGYLQLGNETSSNIIQENCVLQDIFIEGESQQILVVYEWYTTEDLPDIDQTAFAFLLDEQVLYLEPAKMVQNQTKQSSLVSFPEHIQGEHQLKICSGNSGDRSHSSWINIFQVSSMAVSINATQSLKIVSGNDQVVSRYQIEDELIENSNQGQLELSFSQPLDDHQLSIQINDYSPVLLPIFVYTSEPDRVSDARACVLNSQELVISFIQPELQLINHSFYDWQVKYCGIDQESQNWNQLDSFSFFYPHLPLDLLQPWCAENRCLVNLKTEAGVIDLNWNELAVFIKNCDPTGNCSTEQEITISSSCESLFLQPSLQPIVINEIMFNPVGDDRQDWYQGEWIELFNPNSVEIDLSNWIIEDQAGWQIIVSPTTADTDHDTSNSGEAIISAFGYLVVFTRGRAMLNNTGDELFLFNPINELVDQVQYPASSVEDKTYGRVPDGSNHWQPLLDASPLAPNLLE